MICYHLIALLSFAALVAFPTLEPLNLSQTPCSVLRRAKKKQKKKTIPNPDSPPPEHLKYIPYILESYGV